MTPAQEYARLIRDSRRAQLAHDADAARRLEAMLARVARDLAAEIRRVPRGILGDRYRRELLASLYRVLDGFRADFKGLLDAGIVEAARLAEERERALLETLYYARHEIMRPDAALRLSQAMGEASVTFGQVPRLVLERLYARTYRDGLTLSHRLYNLDQEARRLITDAVGEALAKGTSARGLAKAITPHLTAPGVDNVRFRAMRIARTEINVAYREGHIASVSDPETGRLRPYVDAVGWRLSPAHPRTDICDAWAGDDTEGLGPGNYSPGDVPPGHPHCLCYTVSVLAALPDEQFVSRAPLPQDVPESQRRYYGA